MTMMAFSASMNAPMTGEAKAGFLPPVSVQGPAKSDIIMDGTERHMTLAMSNRESNS